MSFDQEYMHGYTEYENHFNKMAEKAYPLLGNITQCGFFEFDSTGHAYLAMNRPDFGEKFIEKKMYKVHENIIYANGEDQKIVPFFSSPCETLMHNKENLIFDKTFDIEHGFLYSEKLKDSDAFRMYAFSSDNKKIYDTLINDLSLVKKFIRFFAEESQQAIKYYRGRKFNLASVRDDYFTKQNGSIKSNKEKLVQILHDFGRLSKKIDISDREWQCVELFIHGKSASQTGNILGISQRTVETHFENLKKKLSIKSKSALVDYLT